MQREISGVSIKHQMDQDSSTGNFFTLILVHLANFPADQAGTGRAVYRQCEQAVK